MKTDRALSCQLLGGLWLHVRAAAFITSLTDVFLWYRSLSSLVDRWSESNCRLRTGEFAQFNLLCTEAWNGLARVLARETLPPDSPAPASKVASILDQEVEMVDIARELATGPWAELSTTRGTLIAEQLIAARTDLWALGFRLLPSDPDALWYTRACTGNALQFPDFLSAIPKHVALPDREQKQIIPANRYLLDYLRREYQLSGAVTLFDIDRALAWEREEAGLLLLRHTRTSNPEDLRSALEHVLRLLRFLDSTQSAHIYEGIVDSALPEYSLRYLLSRLHQHPFTAGCVEAGTVGHLEVSVHRIPSLDVVLIWPSTWNQLLWGERNFKVRVPMGHESCPYPYLDACLGAAGSSSLASNLAIRGNQIRASLEDAALGYFLTKHGSEMVKTGWSAVGHVRRAWFIYAVLTGRLNLPPEAAERLQRLLSLLFFGP